MPQTRGSCGHIRAAWDNHDSCLSCAGCTQENCCPFCEHWSVDTWAIKRRPFKSRRRNMHSSDQSRESSVCRDFSPHDLDHMSLTGPVTGHAMTGPVTGHAMTGPVTGQPVTGHVMTDAVTRYRSVPQTVPVTVDTT
ncbi:hypothetical protein DPMN_015065 [Dreissena polymorpha]|uniref:Uncharacterized protein n=1 Tax=Dreissena polymorpha TaxID=45954 RepID=A0A9D4NC49_DREPO|nr:hypothetical protein DPMN_015065 [Dreissena polymorpha]